MDSTSVIGSIIQLLSKLFGNKGKSQKAGNNSVQIQAENLNLNLLTSSDESGIQIENDALSNLADSILMRIDEKIAMNPYRLGGDEKMNEAAIFLLEERGYVSIKKNESCTYNPIIHFTMTQQGIIRKARLIANSKTSQSFNPEKK